MILISVPAFAAPPITPTLNLGTATVSGSTVSFPVILTNSAGSSISGLTAYIKFNVNSDAFALKSDGAGGIISATIGAAASAAGKSISQSTPSDGLFYITIISLGNSTPIGNGTVAVVTFDIISASPTINEPITIIPSASTPGGYPVTINGNGTTITATVTPHYPIGLTLSGNGTISSTSITPAGQNPFSCTNPGICPNAYYLSGSTITLSAAPVAPATFAGWGVDCSTCNGSTCTITNLTSAKMCSATFSTIYPLGVTISGSGAVKSTSITPAGQSAFNCNSGTCSQNYLSGTSITLSAVPTPSSFFVAWDGNCVGCSGASCTVPTLTSGKACTAIFNPLYPLGVTITGNGAVRSSSIIPAGQTAYSCATPGACAPAYYLPGTAVTLDAVPTPTSVFTAWSGDCLSCSGTSCAVPTLTSARSCTALFTALYPLGVTIIGHGAVNSTDITPAVPVQPPYACNTTGVCPPVNYLAATTVTLAAIPSTEYLFTGWNLCAGAGNCTVAMSAARDVTATFSYVQPAKVVASGGTVVGSYDTLTLAYAAAPTGATIKARNHLFTENWTTSLPAKALRFEGGYGDTYSSQTGNSTIKGVLTIRNGSLIANRLVVE